MELQVIQTIISSVGVASIIACAFWFGKIVSGFEARTTSLETDSKDARESRKGLHEKVDVLRQEFHETKVTVARIDERLKQPAEKNA